MESPRINTTLDYADLDLPAVRPTVRSLKSWVWKWLLTGNRLGVNGAVKRRWYIRSHKMWEYSRGLAYTGASVPCRQPGRKFTVLDVGGAMTAPVFHLASLGDHVVCLDIDQPMIAETSQTAQKNQLKIDARTTDLGHEDPSPADLGAPEGFDRVYCFCVIEHIPPPMQQRVAARMAKLLKPDGLMCLTFDFGEHAPTEAPLHTLEHVDAIRQAIDLPLMGNSTFIDNGLRFPLNRKHPNSQYTFGSMFFKKPAAPGEAARS
jgi:SAM-dependent methyltransferase